MGGQQGFHVACSQDLGPEQVGLRAWPLPKGCYSSPLVVVLQENGPVRPNLSMFFQEEEGI